MPVYAYACTACGNAFDAKQSFAEPALTTCDVCGGALRKQYGTIGVSFNGSGFYRTDSRAAAKAAASPKSDASKGDASPKSDASPKTSSGSKPAATTSTASSGGAGTVA